MHSAALDLARVRRGTRLLDVGCGTGEALLLASMRGADITGIDLAPGFIEFAKERLDTADLRIGDMQELPFKDASFDAVLHTNTLMFSTDRLKAVQEARRVLTPKGRHVVAAWTEDCSLYPLVEALVRLLPEAPPGGGPFALAAPAAISGLFEEAGMQIVETQVIPCPLYYNDKTELVDAMIASTGPMQGVLRSLGERTHEVILDAAAPKRQGDGSYRLENLVRVVAAVPTRR